MYRYQKGFIFNEYTFVVNKEDVRNAKDEDFVEGTALLPEHLFILENQMHGMWELAEHEYNDCAKCSQCAVEFSLTGEWTFEEDHPRTCGENFKDTKLLTILMGSPPHLRGKL